MNARDRRKAMRAAFRAGAEQRAKMAAKIGLEPGDYHVGADTVESSCSIIPPPWEQTRRARALRNPFTRQLIAEYARGWGPL